MVMVKSIPQGVQAVFPMLVCKNPEAEMSFCASAFGAIEQVRRPGPDGSPIHIAMRITTHLSSFNPRSRKWLPAAHPRATAARP